MTPADMARLMARAHPDARGWSEAEFSDLLARPGALLTGDSASFVLGQVIAGEAEIFMVLTDPDRRREGLARTTLQGFHEAATRSGATRVILEVAADNAAALGLYLSLGYVRFAERRGYYPRKDGAAISALMLEKRL